MVSSGKYSDRIALTDGESLPQWTGAGTFTPTKRASLIINARMGAQPQSLSDLVQAALARSAKDLGVKVDISHIECFAPSPPTPVHRLSAAGGAMA
jgi:hypothetical protein